MNHRTVIRRAISAFLALSASAIGFTSTAAAIPPPTLTVSNCIFTDYRVPIGSTVIFTFGPDCRQLGPYINEGGDPTIINEPEVGHELVWRKAVGRSSAQAACEQGWSPSWAQWPDEGRGGFTCEYDINWGYTVLDYGRVLITINGDNDEALGNEERSYVMGCSEPDFAWPVLEFCR